MHRSKGGLIVIAALLLFLVGTADYCLAQETYEYEEIWQTTVRANSTSHNPRCWDIDLWTNSDSLGKAWTSRLTVYYQLTTTATVDSFTLSDTLHVIEQLACCNINGSPGVILSISGQLHETGEQYDYETKRNYYLALVRLSPFAIVSFKVVGTELDWDMQEQQNWKTRISQLEGWPPLPARTQYAVFVLKYDYSYGWGMAISHESSGTIHATALTDTTDIYLGSGTEFSLFNNNRDCQLAVYDWRYSGSQLEGGGWTQSDDYAYCVQSLPGTVSPRVANDGFTAVSAQQDRNNAARMVLLRSNGRLSVVVDTEDYDPQWSTQDYWLEYSIVCDESLDDRFLNRNDWDDPIASYQVLDAANGSILGNMTPLIGNVEKVLRRTDDYDLLLTKDYDSGYYDIHVYRNTAYYRPQPDFRVTLSRASEGMLRLSWIPVPNAYYYRIWYLDPPDTTWRFMYDLPTTSHIFPMPASERRQYKVVTYYH